MKSCCNTKKNKNVEDFFPLNKFMFAIAYYHDGGKNNWMDVSANKLITKEELHLKLVLIQIN